MVCSAVGSGVGDDVVPSVGDGDGAGVGDGVGRGVGKGVGRGVGTDIHLVCPGSSLVHSLTPHALHFTAPGNDANWPLAQSTHRANNGSCMLP